ncbi:hypothetical protein PanWU01x14_097440 [Parasponia andersonii]|uniref:Uncharacterized protein n=1 Tax=Parasponia andersonii TaxID=3476 RepID=A0A2P5D4F4_PARAD|nr:hypothetical protein PanWU01x14_097440 [Parasponia andersonii]
MVKHVLLWKVALHLMYSILLPSLPTSQEVAKRAILDGLDNIDIIPWFHPEVSRQYCPSQETQFSVLKVDPNLLLFCKWEVLKG